jgi:hypothetical protein
MKKVILLFCTLIFITIFSQNQTKKWNSISERYEYFNSNGKLLGYEKYNNILKQWEYFDSESKNKYDSYNNSTAEFYSDLDLQQNATIKHLKYQNNTSQNNYQKILNLVARWDNFILAQNYTQNRKTKIINDAHIEINKSISNVDYTYNLAVNTFAEWITNLYATLQHNTKEMDVKNTKDETSSNKTLAEEIEEKLGYKIPPSEIKEGVIQEVKNNSPIFEKSDLKGKKIGEAKNNQVTIIKKINGATYKVKSGDLIGYIWSGSFKF